MCSKLLKAITYEDTAIVASRSWMQSQSNSCLVHLSRPRSFWPSTPIRVDGSTGWQLSSRGLSPRMDWNFSLLFIGWQRWTREAGLAIPRWLRGRFSHGRLERDDCSRSATSFSPGRSEEHPSEL